MPHPIDSDYKHRLMTGQWLATSRAFSAKYAGRCLLCGKAIGVGDQQRNLNRVTSARSESGWAHESCAVDARIPSFIGKVGA